jgi:DNA replication protein DnaC
LPLALHPTRPRADPADELARQFKELSLQTEKSKETDTELNALKESLVASVDGQKVALIALPKLGFSDTTDRLNFDTQDKVVMLVRDITLQVVDTVSTKFPKSIYVSGPQGIGKSHALYTYACVLCTQRQDNVRVTYVQSCLKWVASHNNDEFRYIIDELYMCATFQTTRFPPAHARPSPIGRRG